MNVHPEYTPIPVVTPSVPLRGALRATLCLRLEAAYDATREAVQALGRCRPHGSTYGTDLGHLDQATAQHEARLMRLYAVLDSLEAEIIQIDTENPAPPRRNVCVPSTTGAHLCI